MSSYKQLTYAQSCQIEVLYRSGFSQQSFVYAVGASQPKISRELRRNTGERGYRHQQAQRKRCDRRSDAVNATKMKPAVLALIAHKLHQYWSPEQISCHDHFLFGFSSPEA
jgi:IS30 family transposase|tara:strand:+ start:507 stop:839 length:333 start_codon:yes stop_codon:yes gene_type:complete